MFRRLIRFVLASAALGGAGFAVFKVVQSRKSGAGMPSGDDSIMPTRSEAPLVQPSLMDGLDLRRASTNGDNSQLLTEAPPAEAVEAAEAAAAPPETEPAPPTPAARSASREGSGWVEPEEGGGCPAGFPVKAKLASGIFHVPGMLAYDRTTPDRCYPDEAAAEAAGLRKAKR